MVANHLAIRRRLFRKANFAGNTMPTRNPRNWNSRARSLTVSLLLSAALSAHAFAGNAASAGSPPTAREIKPPGEGMIEHPCPAQTFVEPDYLAELGKPPKYSREFVAAYVANSTYQKKYDWAFLCRYQGDNAAWSAAHSPKVVFMGDSITQNWIHYDPSLFTNGVVDRGISGQTTPQMLLRFYQDVIDLHPRVVHILAGSNDIAGNTGPTSPEAYKNNIRAMVQLAKANGVAVVLASIPPSNRFAMHPAIAPAPIIAELNRWLKAYAAQEGAIYADYYSALVGSDQGMTPSYTFDGLHPSTAGYRVMRPIVEQAITAAEQRQGRR